jgi:hypothetical protein
MLGVPLESPVKLKREYQQAEFFPHLLIPKFISPELAMEMELEFPKPDEMPLWYDPQRFPMEPGKMIMDLPDPSKFPKIFSLLEYLKSEDFSSWISDVVGEKVFIDPMCSGGFVHLAGRGCRLGVHLDRQVHKSHQNWLRVCTLILYLNEYWESDWNGDLQLWAPPKSDQAMVSEKLKSIEPSIGSFLLISNTAQAYHGYPVPLACPEGVYRRCLVGHFYTIGEPTTEMRRASQFFLTPHCEDTPEIRSHLRFRLAGGNNLARR